MISELNPYLPPDAPPPPSGLNPWTSIWLKPQATIRQILAEDSEKMVLVMALLSAIPGALAAAIVWRPDYDLAASLKIVLSIGLTLLLSVGGVYIGARLLRWTGDWVGGRASAKELRAAIAWSYIPSIWAAPLVAVNLAIQNPDLFRWQAPSAALSRISIGLTAVQVAIRLWGMVVLLLAVGEAQGVSIWKALLNSILAAFIALAIAAGIVLAIDSIVAFAA
jgi:hypothetical protein